MRSQDHARRTRGRRLPPPRPQQRLYLRNLLRGTSKRSRSHLFLHSPSRRFIQPPPPVLLRGILTAATNKRNLPGTAGLDAQMTPRMMRLTMLGRSYDLRTNFGRV